MTYRKRWPLRLTVTLAALLAPVTVAVARGAPRELVAVGSLVSLERKDDGTGTLIALVRSLGPRGETPRAPIRPGKGIFLLTKETRFLKGAGPDGEAAAVNADLLPSRGNTPYRAGRLSSASSARDFSLPLPDSEEACVTRLAMAPSHPSGSRNLSHQVAGPGEG